MTFFKITHQNKAALNRYFYTGNSWPASEATENQQIQIQILFNTIIGQSGSHQVRSSFWWNNRCQIDGTDVKIKAVNVIDAGYSSFL